LSVDSGIDDVFGSPGSDKSATVVGDTPLKTKNQSGDRDTGCQLVASNPFDNDKTRILFKAVDDLREWDAQDYVEIPQVCSSQRPCQTTAYILRSLSLSEANRLASPLFSEGLQISHSRYPEGVAHVTQLGSCYIVLNRECPAPTGSLLRNQTFLSLGWPY
jgi:hypothetical protein